MKIIQLPNPVYDYLVHVIENHAQKGIHPEEGLAISHLWDVVTKQVQTIDDEKLKRSVPSGAIPGDVPNPAKAVSND